MVAVVSNLIVHFAAIGIHFHEPIQSPSDLVEDIGCSVCTRKTGSVVLVTKDFRVLGIGKQHLINRIRRSCDILKVIACVVPSAFDIDDLTRFCGMVNDKTVVGMTGILQVGIVPTALLAHVLQGIIGSPFVNFG